MKYQVCEVCVMDTSDPDIIFMGTKGCNNCIKMLSDISSSLNSENSPNENLQKMVKLIKSSKKHVEYDCILGISGGLDSSFVALKCFDWGLNPLLLHIDTGWNSEVAIRNIQSIIDFTGWKLNTYVVNWSEMRDLQLSFLKSGISNQDVPQDHAIFSAIYKFAQINKIKFVINGGNTATEGIFPKNWHGSSMDARNLIDIHKTFGMFKLSEYPTTSFSKYYFYYPFVKRIKPIRPLNFIKYDKKLAIKELEERTGWKPYPRKHGESNFTKFFQEYYLVKRFGIDKRRAHLSSEIVSGQILRNEALDLLSKPAYDLSELGRDTEYVCRKLRLDMNEFDELLNLPRKTTRDFKNWENYYAIMKRIQAMAEKFFNLKFKIYR